MKRILFSYWPILAITLVVIIASINNVVPGTFLTGWDNLHPEFDFKTNLTRAWYGVWQEYQGVGVLAGNGHAADLFRVAGLWVSSLLLPQWLIRYFYHLSMWWLGGVGMYWLAKKQLIHSKFGSLAAALFFLLNLGTVQNFYAPYESFSHHFAFLPWLLLTLFTYLRKPSKRNLVWFGIVNLLAVPMSYIPTIFIVYSLTIFICWSSWFIINRSLHSVKIICLSGIVLLLTNAFWLLPFGYFVSRGTDFVGQSTINRMFTEEAFLRNQKYGKVWDVALLRGFWFDTSDLTTNEGDHDFMMRPWMDHISNPFISIVLFVLFSMVVMGILVSFRQKNKWRWTMLSLFIISIFALLNNNWPSGWLFQWMQNTLPFFKQIFRFPFTKFIVLGSLSYAVGFGWFCQWLFKKKFKFISIGFVSLLLLLGSFPIFKGNLFYSKLRVEIPLEYFSLYNFFQQESGTGRVVNLPQPSFWGWANYNWGYRGSGFPWYGIPQPIMDRAFDVWSLSNENFYHEMSYALYDSGTSSHFLSVLDKYGVDYVWVDKNIIAPHKPALLNMEQMRYWLEQSGNFTPLFESGNQKVYKRINSVQGFHIEYAMPVTAPQSTFQALDLIYSTIGTYYENQGKSSFPLIYPFTNIDSRVSNWNFEKLSHNWQMPLSYDGKLSLTLNNKNNLIPLVIEGDSNELKLTQILPQLSIGDRQIPMNLNPKIVDVSGTKSFAIKLGSKVIQSSTLPQTVFVKSKEQLKLFDTSKETHYPINSLLDLTVRNCLDSKDSVYKSNITDGVLTLTGSNSRPCIYGRLKDWLPLSMFESPNQLDKVGFELFGTPTTNVTVCLTKEGSEDCYQYAKVNYEGKGNWDQVYWFSNYEEVPLDQIWLKLELRADGDESQFVSVRNPYITLLENSVFDSSIDFADSTHQSVEVDGFSDFKLDLSKEMVKTIQPEEMIDSQKNCFSLGQGEYSQELQSENGKSYIRFMARDASSCQTVYLGAEFQLGGLIHITTRNISGRPLHICIRHDPPGHCVVEDILPGKPSLWLDQTYIIPPITTTDSSLFLEIDDYAVGDEIRTNDVASISVYRFPYNLIKGIGLLPNDRVMVSEQLEQGGSVTSKSTISSHKISIENSRMATNFISGDKRAILINYQSYDSGWIAVQQWNWKKPFDFAQGLRHVKVNGWANGFIIDEARSMKDEEGSTNSSIVIFYWPQLLEWSGLGILGMMAVLLGWKYKH